MSCMDGGLYSLWRKDCGPTLYPSNKTPVTADVLIAGFLFAACILAASFLLIVPGYRGKAKWFVLIRSIVFVFVTTSILVCNFGQDWEVSKLTTKTPYRPGLDEEIHADIGVKIGLRSINVTLKADPEIVSFKNGTHEERINYNERYRWNDLGFHQGRNGFGPFAGLYNREFRESQFRGTPLPILWVSEYFTLDGEGIRWGRHYRQAGWYAHIMMWLAFPLWIVASALPYMVLSYAGYYSIFTGLALLIANIIFASVRNATEITGVIPFEDGKMEFAFGWCFWLNLGTGILCLIIGVAIVVLDIYLSPQISTFFGANLLQDYEEFYADAFEIQAILDKQSLRRTSRFSMFRKKPQYQRNNSRNGGTPMSDLHGNGAADARAVEVEIYEDVESPGPSSPSSQAPPVVQRFRRRGNTLSRFAKPDAPPLPMKQGQPQSPGEMPPLPDKHGAHHSGQAQAPVPRKKGKGKQQAGGEASRQQQQHLAAAGKSPQGPKPKPSPQVKAKPNVHTDGASSATTAKKLPPAPPKKSSAAAQAPKARDDSGRTQTQPQDILSGDYDNDYENQDEIKAIAVAHQEGLTKLMRLQAANARL